MRCREILGLFVAFASLVAHVGASYIIDSNNAIVSYSPQDRWHNDRVVEAYANTSEIGGSGDSGCITVDNCEMSVPFRGTGITLYGSVVWALSFNASIDGIPVGQMHFEGVYGCCNSTIGPANNVTLYNLQGLPEANHVLTVRLVDTTGKVFIGNGSEMRFDYALVNGTASAVSSPFSNAKTQCLGPAIGGSLGGTVVGAVVAVGVLWWLRRGAGAGPNAPDVPLVDITNANGAPPLPAAPRHPAEEECRLLGRMYTLNVPAEEFAPVVDALRARGQAAPVYGAGIVQERRPLPAAPPPPEDLTNEELQLWNSLHGLGIQPATVVDAMRRRRRRQAVPAAGAQVEREPQPPPLLPNGL